MVEYGRLDTLQDMINFFVPFIRCNVRGTLIMGWLIGWMINRCSIVKLV